MKSELLLRGKSKSFPKIGNGKNTEWCGTTDSLTKMRSTEWGISTCCWGSSPWKQLPSGPGEEERLLEDKTEGHVIPGSTDLLNESWVFAHTRLTLQRVFLWDTILTTQASPSTLPPTGWMTQSAASSALAPCRPLSSVCLLSFCRLAYCPPPLESGLWELALRLPCSLLNSYTSSVVRHRIYKIDI